MAESTRKGNMEKAEGDRETAITNLESGRRSEGGEGTSEGAGITNRPRTEEEQSQAEVPERGDRKGGAHAG